MRVVASVDLSAIRDNVAILKKRSGSKYFMAVVKANAYGHGMVEVAKAAKEGGATWFGVATIEEGIELTDSGINEEILLLSEPEASDDAFHAIRYWELTPTVYSREFIKKLPKGTKVHLKLDTGMHRVGAWYAECDELIKLIEEQGLKLEGIFTHLADANNLGTTSKQVNRFNDAVMNAPEGVLLHVFNTAGVLYKTGYDYDMVRCGLGMYGLTGREFGLRPALSLTSRISAMAFRIQGSELSYSRVRKQGDGYVGTIPVGYADGIPLRAAGRGWISIPGEDRQFPILAVTMDMMLVDFGRNVFEVGQPVELIGPNVPVRDWARWLDTIPYEIVCGIGPRVIRNYTWGEEKS